MDNLSVTLYTLSMSKIDVSTLRRDLFTILDRLPSSGPVEIVRHGKVVATLGGPPARVAARKPAFNVRRLKRICQKHHIKRFALFGSILRDDFGPDSDVDVLVDPVPGHLCTLEARVAAEEDLTRLFGRRIDLVKRAVIEQSPNEIRKRAILDTARVVYEA
jgi:predicted nucleotidyltransferase